MIFPKQALDSAFPHLTAWAIDPVHAVRKGSQRPVCKDFRTVQTDCIASLKCVDGFKKNRPAEISAARDCSAGAPVQLSDDAGNRYNNRDRV
jgi:hypothetical protein